MDEAVNSMIILLGDCSDHGSTDLEFYSLSGDD
jgi:hypothetical protein